MLLMLIMLAFLLSVLSSLLACTAGPVRTEKPIEAWMIDSDDATLYRHVSPVTEEAMLILGNPDAEKMMCFDRESVEEIIMRARE